MAGTRKPPEETPPVEAPAPVEEPLDYQRLADEVTSRLGAAYQETADKLLEAANKLMLEAGNIDDRLSAVEAAADPSVTEAVDQTVERRLEAVERAIGINPNTATLAEIRRRTAAEPVPKATPGDEEVIASAEDPQQ